MEDIGMICSSSLTLILSGQRICIDIHAEESVYGLFAQQFVPCMCTGVVLVLNAFDLQLFDKLYTY
jgi:hypothetical protein